MADLEWGQMFAAAGVLLAPIGSVVGWFAGSRKRTADVALAEAHSAKARAESDSIRVDSLAEIINVQREEAAERKAESNEHKLLIQDLQRRVTGLARVQDEHGLMKGYIDDVWDFHDAGSHAAHPAVLPGNRPSRIIAIVRPPRREPVEEGTSAAS